MESEELFSNLTQDEKIEIVEKLIDHLGLKIMRTCGYGGSTLDLIDPKVKSPPRGYVSVPLEIEMVSINEDDVLIHTVNGLVYGVAKSYFGRSKVNLSRRLIDPDGRSVTWPDLGVTIHIEDLLKDQMFVSKAPT